MISFSSDHFLLKLTQGAPSETNGTTKYYILLAHIFPPAIYNLIIYVLIYIRGIIYANARDSPITKPIKK